VAVEMEIKKGAFHHGKVSSRTRVHKRF